MNLTERMTKACEALWELKSFNSLYVLAASCLSEAEIREDCRHDELTEEETRAAVEDYVCVHFHLDTYVGESEHPYQSMEFDHNSLQRDFREWLLQFFDGDESSFPEEIDLEGGDTEFMKPGYGN